MIQKDNRFIIGKSIFTSFKGSNFLGPPNVLDPVAVKPFTSVLYFLFVYMLCYIYNVIYLVTDSGWDHEQF